MSQSSRYKSDQELSAELMRRGKYLRGVPNPAPVLNQQQMQARAQAEQQEAARIQQRPPEPAAEIPQIPEAMARVIEGLDKTSESSEDSTEEVYIPNTFKFLNGWSLNILLYASMKHKSFFVSFRDLFRMDIQENGLVFTSLRSINLANIHGDKMTYYLPLPSSLNGYSFDDMDLIAVNTNYSYAFIEQKTILYCNHTFTERQGGANSIVEQAETTLDNKYYIRITLNQHIFIPLGLKLIVKIKGFAPKGLAEDYLDELEKERKTKERRIEQQPPQKKVKKEPQE